MISDDMKVDSNSTTLNDVEMREWIQPLEVCLFV
jgi:hypothetical protein